MLQARFLGIKNLPLWLFLHTKLRLALAFILLLSLTFSSLPSISQDFDRNSLVDGELHDLHIVTLDRMFAVGDRGLILGSDNAGKTWSVRNARSDFTLHGVFFLSETIGCAVGGVIEPFTHRSHGVALTTNDGGKTWVRSQSTIPRLTGLTSTNSTHLIAWGDWSTTDQTSLYMSTDEGLTWVPVTSPCGHIETLGVKASIDGQKNSQEPRFGRTETPRMIIDRLSRCFFSEDGVNFELVPISGFSSDEPIRSCCHSGSKWWICGDNGLLFSSDDGRQWIRHFLPGTQSDWDLLSLRKVVARGEDIWVGGFPGCVLWHSNNGGKNWNVIPTNNENAVRSLAMFEDSIVAYCGSMATINISRNQGAGWRIAHQSANRLCTLNIACTADRIAWDLLATITKDARRTAGCVVVHDRNLEQKSGYRPEQASRSFVAGKRLELSVIETLSTFPISDSLQPRSTDSRHYAQSGTLLKAPTSQLFRILVQKVRSYKPDLVVTECAAVGSELQRNLSETVELATTWASRRDYLLFSEESQIPNDHWAVQRTLYRGELSTGRQFHPSTILKNVGMVLGETIGPTLAIANTPEESSLYLHSRMRYRSGINTPNSLLNPLDGLVIDGKANLKEKLYGASRAGLLVSTANWFNADPLRKHPVINPYVRDTAWEAKLSQSAKMMESDPRAIVLIEIAREARQAGHWNKWSSTLDYLIAIDPKSSYAEYAQLELMRFTGSMEVNQMIANQVNTGEQRSDNEILVSSSTAIQTSPFAQDFDTAIKPASYAHKPQLIPIATHGGLPEFYRLLSNLPKSWEAHRFDPEWGWLIASRFRQYQATKRQDVAVDPYQLQIQSSNFFPRLSENLLNWQLVHSYEQQLSRQSEFSDTTKNKAIKEISKTQDRPFLDGLPNEALWSSSLKFELQDPWGEPGRTVISMARDDEFIYLFSQTIESEPNANGNINSNRKRDSLNDRQESIRLRLDLDRDYSTWFELGWSDSGEMIDACNDMLQWNPDWYVATKPTAYGWNAEIAIPIESLASSWNAAHAPLTHIAVNVIHTVPGKGARVMAPSVSDRIQADQWTIIKW